MIITCPHCHAECESPPDLVGTEVRCPKCRNTFVVAIPVIAESPTLPLRAKRPSSVKTACNLILTNLGISFAFQVVMLVSLTTSGQNNDSIARGCVWFAMKVIEYSICFVVVRRILAGSALARSVLNVVGVMAILVSVPVELGQLSQTTSGVQILGPVVGLVTSILLIVAIVLVNKSEANDWFRNRKEKTKKSANQSSASNSSAHFRQHDHDCLTAQWDDSGSKNDGTHRVSDDSITHNSVSTREIYAILGLVSMIVVCCLLSSIDSFSIFGRKPGEIRSISIDGTRFDFAWCPPGTFMMGSPDYESGRYEDESRHEVTLTKGFWIGTTEITQGQWKSLMNGETIHDVFRNAVHDEQQYDFRNGKSTYREHMVFDRNENPKNMCGDLDPNCPIYYVGWNEAARFCSALTEKERTTGHLPKGYEYRLPTEAEWEYACRAGTASALPNGRNLSILGKNNAPDLDSIAWYGGNSCRYFEGRGWDTDQWTEKQYQGGRAAARRVAQKEPNNWGVYDMLGNVWEWTNDRWSLYSRTSVTNPVGGQRGTDRVIRGGAWDMPAALCRSAIRTSENVGERKRNLGFRVVLGPILTQ